MAAAVEQSPADMTDGESAAAASATNQIVSFRLANEEYGVDIMRVQEIILPGAITEMPEVPDYIRGLINLRGHVIPIVDLRTRFGLPVGDRTEHTRIIVVNVKKRTIGMVVDAVSEVLRIDRDQLEPAPSSIVGTEHGHVKSLVKFDDKLLILLDIERILSNDEMAALAAD